MTWALLVMGCLVFAAPARGQTTLYTFNGDSALDGFGRSVSGAGDVNGDGFADLIVGAPTANTVNGNRTGSARVIESPFIDPSVLVINLIAAVIDLNLQQGIEKRLNAMLDATLRALAILNQNNIVTAVNMLDAFIALVANQSGNQIPREDANALIAAAQAAQEVIALLSP